MLIKLTIAHDISGEPIGDALVDTDSIESIVNYSKNPMMNKTSEITFKSVITGFHGNDDMTHLYQTTLCVMESVDEIAILTDTNTNPLSQE